MRTTTAPYEDLNFMVIVRQLEDCANRHGSNCQKNCLSFNKCNQLFDNISELASDKPLTPDELNRFKHELSMLTQQSSIFDFLPLNEPKQSRKMV